MVAFNNLCQYWVIPKIEFKTQFSNNKIVDLIGEITRNND